jgi:hypothetical protein
MLQLIRITSMLRYAEQEVDPQCLFIDLGPDFRATAFNRKPKAFGRAFPAGSLLSSLRR